MFKIIELENKNLISCSKDYSFIFYTKNKSRYKKEYKKNKYGCESSLIQIKDNEICYCISYGNNKLIYDICFYDCIQKKLIIAISKININCNSLTFKVFKMITKYLLAVGDAIRIFIFNVNHYSLEREIEIFNTSIFGFCMLDEIIFLTGDNNGSIIQWKIEGNNIIKISIKEKAHSDNIYTLIKMENGLIASGSCDKSIKIWQNLN